MHNERNPIDITDSVASLTDILYPISITSMWITVEMSGATPASAVFRWFRALSSYLQPVLNSVETDTSNGTSIIHLTHV